MHTAEHANAWLYLQHRPLIVATTRPGDRQLRADERQQDGAKRVEPATSPTTSTAPCTEEVF
jgi:hypothetical protein